MKILLNVKDGNYTFIESIKPKVAKIIYDAVTNKATNGITEIKIYDLQISMDSFLIGNINDLLHTEEYIKTITVPIIKYKAKSIYFVYCAERKIINYKSGQAVVNSKAGYRASIHTDVNGYYWILGSEPSITSYTSFVRNLTNLLVHNDVLIYKTNKDGRTILSS